MRNRCFILFVFLLSIGFSSIAFSESDLGDGDSDASWKLHPIHDDDALLAALLESVGYISLTSKGLSEVSTTDVLDAINRYHRDLSEPEGRMLTRDAWRRIGTLSLTKDRENELLELSKTRHSAAAWIKTRLITLGYLDDIGPEFRFTEEEIDVIKEYQMESGLPVTGVIDPTIYKTLIAVKPAEAMSTDVVSTPRIDEDLMGEKTRKIEWYYYLQLGAYERLATAERYANKMLDEGFEDVFIGKISSGRLHAVCMGPYFDIVTLHTIRDQYEKVYSNAIIRVESSRIDIEGERRYRVVESDRMGEQPRHDRHPPRPPRRDDHGLPERILDVRAEENTDTLAETDAREIMGEKEFEDLKGDINVDLDVMGAQSSLESLGYDPGPIDGLMGAKTQGALAKFQRAYSLPPTGTLDERTKRELERVFYEDRTRRTRLSGKHVRPPVETVEVVDPEVPEFALAVDDEIYAIERVDCKSDHEAWVLIYRGAVNSLQDSNAQINIATRWGVWFDTTKRGENRDDWLCIPKERFCFSEVDFSKWKGLLRRGDNYMARKMDSIPAHYGLVPLAAKTAKEQCGFKE